MIKRKISPKQDLPKKYYFVKANGASRAIYVPQNGIVAPNSNSLPGILEPK